MKFKYFATLVALTFTCGAQAQEDQSALQSRLDSLENVINTREADNAFRARQDNMWRRRKSFTIGWVNQTLSSVDEFPAREWKSKFGVTLSPWGKTWYLHKAIAGMLRFGIDGNLDANYAQYEKGSGIKFSGLGNLGGFEDEDFSDFDPDLDPDLDVDLGMHQIEVGIGIGPSVTVAPFYPLGNKYLDDLKVRLYYHLMPSGSVIVKSEDGETDVNGGFCMFQRFGGAISWKCLSLGVEHRWGQAKYNSFNFSTEGEDGESGLPETSSSKTKFKTSATRIYLAFRFGK